MAATLTQTKTSMVASAQVSVYLFMGAVRFFAYCIFYYYYMDNFICFQKESGV